MIHDEIIELLIDPDPEVRKSGVKELGKSKNPDALPYLAEVYRDDEDPEVRELARKAGVYIRKQAGEGAIARKPSSQSKRSSSTVDDSVASLYTTDGGSLYAGDGGEDDLYTDIDDAPLPSELHVSAAAKERAKGLVEQALDFNMRGENGKATKTLQKALKIDPTLMHDSYTISLAANITGLGGPEAVQMLGPDDDELRKRASSASGRSGARGGRSGTQILMAYGVLFGGAVVLLGYFLFAWIDFRSLPTDYDGETVTVGEAIDRANEELDELFVLFGEDSPEADGFRDAFGALQFYLNGLDTTLVSIGSTNMFDAMGLIEFERTIAETVGLGGSVDESAYEYDYEPAPLDYTLLLVPLVAVVAIILGILLLTSGKMLYWIITILFGIGGIVPLAYFYTSILTDVVPENASLGDFGSLSAPSAADLIGLGFWVSLVGMILVLMLPFIAMLTAPAPPQEAS
jgi:hypothetical protein